MERKMGRKMKVALRGGVRPIFSSRFAQPEDSLFSAGFWHFFEHDFK